MRKYFVLLLIVVFGCSGNYTEEISYRRIIPEHKKEIAAEWITKTVEKANPFSDEEPEDNIKQAQLTAKELFGEMTIGIIYRRKIDGHCVFVPYNLLSNRQKRICDQWSENGKI